MKRFVKYLFLLQAAVLLTAACGKSAEEEFPGNRGSLEKTFRASMPSTKVAVDDSRRALWEDGDDISVEGSRFTLESPGSASAVFRGTVTEDKDNYLAMLPWTDDYVFGDRTVSGTLPNRQPANEGGCAWPLAYGWSVGSSITFHHLTTVLQLTLGGDMTDVREIVLRGNDGENLEPIAGDFSLALDSDGAFSSFAGGPIVYEAVALTGTLEANKTYCFNVLGLGTEFARGLTLEFLFADGPKYITKDTPITLKKGEWVNLSNGIKKTSLTPMSKGIATESDWAKFKDAYETLQNLDDWTWNGEILLKDDITLSASDALNTLDIPLNGNGHTITYTDGTTSLIGTLSADVHDLNLSGNIDFAGNSAVGALTSIVSTGVTISNVNSGIDITAGALGQTHNLKIGGLAGTVDGASGRVTFDNCTVTGTIKSLNYAHSVGGILAHGGIGGAPESIFEGCTFNGTISYAQGSCPFDFSDGQNKDRTAGRVGGIIGDASRVSVLRDCSTGGAWDIRLNGMTLGNGGVGGLVGRTTGDAVGYTMSVTLEGTNTNNAAITVHDAKADQHGRFRQVIGSVIKAPAGSGTESGSLTFDDTPAPSTTTTGHFRLCQVAPRHTVSIKDIKNSLDGTRSSTTQHYMSYLIVTTNNKVIVVDGGWAGDAPYLKSLIKSFGGHVDAWFISHPHEDHISALSEILRAPEGITIGTIYHTKASSSMSNDVVNTLYSRMEAFDCDIVDIREPGGRYDIDGVGIKVLSVSDEVLNSSNLNDSSLALRIWDENKSVVLLGDCMVAEGRKLLATCPADLNCDFLQLGHHGNKGPEKAFYDELSFSYALVPTAEWIWHPELYYSSTPSNLDGGATRGWIEAKVPGKIITSYEHGDVWIDESGKYSFTGNTIDGFIKDESDYFN